jgi:ribosome-associated heat shock protein Hsp15
MRIDQFLWFCRVYKSRNLASNACKKGYVKIDSKPLKPSALIHPNLTFTVKKDGIINQYKIKDLPGSRVGAKIVELYIENITPKSELEKKIMINAQKKNYKFDRKPSKKERREINKYLNK